MGILSLVYSGINLVGGYEFDRDIFALFYGISSALSILTGGLNASFDDIILRDVYNKLSEIKIE
jgi:hypothetical protein